MKAQPLSLPPAFPPLSDAPPALADATGVRWKNPAQPDARLLETQPPPDGGARPPALCARCGEPMALRCPCGDGACVLVTHLPACAACEPEAALGQLQVVGARVCDRVLRCLRRR